MSRDEGELGLGTLSAFGAGGISMGMLLMGVNYFALVYYSQALGISGSVVGSALALALVSDAVSDPLVGALSDRTRTRWGRRHPYLYAAVLPSAFLFYLFWNPPAWAIASDAVAFWFLLGTASLMRLAATLFEVPSNALVAELTTDYDRRSDLMSYRMNLYYFSTAMFSVVMFYYFLADTPEYPQGNLRVAGYEEMGLAAALVIGVTMLIQAVGTHRHIPRMRDANLELHPQGLKLREVFAPFKNRSLLAIVLSALFSSTQSGTAAALWIYMMTYFWELTSTQMAWFSFIALFGTPIAFYLVPRAFRGREKKHIAVAVMILAVVVDVGPILLRVAGLMPPNGTTLLIAIIFSQAVFLTICGTFVQVALGSMLAEIVEEHAVQTGQHIAGLITSTRSFTLKVMSGAGIAVAGVVLDFIAFPTQSAVKDVPPETIFSLGIAYGPILMILSLTAVVILGAYRISRSDHEENLARLGADVAES